MNFRDGYGSDAGHFSLIFGKFWRFVQFELNIPGDSENGNCQEAEVDLEKVTMQKSSINNTLSGKICEDLEFFHKLWFVVAC